MRELTELKTASDLPTTNGAGGEINKFDEPEGAEFIPGGSSQFGSLHDQPLSWPCYGLSTGQFDKGGIPTALAVGGSPGTSIRSAVSPSAKDRRLGTGPPSARRLTPRAPHWSPPATPSPLRLLGSITRTCALPMPGGAPRTSCRWARSI